MPTERVHGTVRAVQRGAVRPLGPKGVPSAIVKTPVSGPVAVGALGLAGDAQGDPARHGGVDKAVHVYPLAHYAAWARDFPEQADRFSPGAFGENIVLEGLSEGDVCIGDRFDLGTARVQISQARQPCWKLNLRFDLPDMARRVQECGRTGWYVRVLVPGTVAAGDPVTLAARPNPEWDLARVQRLLYRDALNRPALAEFAGLDGLSASWRNLAQRRLESGAVEDWVPRLGV
ncbi:MAG: MOSC domain-containing protein [Alphaproteobacteria bacterium HGW-Alphaproteobacteria-3]|nr:MAG: MOSC domain-containing protein [Alphaproteobacteria bacterium HGW-Alphaproteobacteria-3]